MVEPFIATLSLMTLRLSNARIDVEIGSAKVTVAVLNFSVFLIEPHFRN
jgi:hypothetical protein